MNKTKLTLIVLIIVSIILAFSLKDNVSKHELDYKKNDVDSIVIKQFSYLNEESAKYDIQNPNFRTTLKIIVDTTTKYARFMKKRINPFKMNSRVDEPIILSPYLFNNAKDRAVIMVLNRILDGFNQPAEEIGFLKGKKENTEWHFKLVKGHTHSITYTNGYPILSDKEIALRMIPHFITWGYMDRNNLKINDNFFYDETWDYDED